MQTDSQEKLEEELRRLMCRSEELEPELSEFITDGPLGQMIHHPFFVRIGYIPQLNARFNEEFLKMKRSVDEARNDRDWSRFLWLHEKPYRFNALDQIWGSIRRERKKAELFIDVWTVSENLWQTRDIWEDMIEQIPNSHFHAAMEAEDRETLDSFEYPLHVYRGGNPEHDQCWSWTTSRKTAEWFSQRFEDVEDDAQGEVFEDVLDDAERIAFYYSGRGEYELVLREGDI